MEISDDALEAKNLFAVEPQDHTQHAMGRRMLRPHINDELVRVQKSLVWSVEIERRECVRIRH